MSSETGVKDGACLKMWHVVKLDTSRSSSSRRKGGCKAHSLYPSQCFTILNSQSKDINVPFGLLSSLRLLKEDTECAYCVPAPCC